MSDENPPEANPPGDAAPEGDSPTEASGEAAGGSSADATAEEPTQPTTSAATPPPPAKQPRATVHVPRWVALVVAAAVLLGAGFAIGWIAAPGGGTEVVSRPIPRFVFPGGGSGGGFGGGAPGRVGGAFLGVEISTASGSTPGASVASVQSGSPAAQAGLQAGDVITAIDGSSVTNPAQLSQDIASHQPGNQVTITYTRNGASSQAQVTLGSRPAPSATG